MPEETQSRVINGQRWTGHPKALDAMEQLCASHARRKASVPPEQSKAALDCIIGAIRSHPDTDSGTALRRFLWSLWNRQHYLNLCTLGRSLDAVFSEAVVMVFTAYMRDALSEEQIGQALTASGEFERWDTALVTTPNGTPVDYPPLPSSLREWVAATPAQAEREVMP